MIATFQSQQISPTCPVNQKLMVLKKVISRTGKFTTLKALLHITLVSGFHYK